MKFAKLLSWKLNMVLVGFDNASLDTYIKLRSYFRNISQQDHIRRCADMTVFEYEYAGCVKGLGISVNDRVVMPRSITAKLSIIYIARDRIFSEFDTTR